MTEKLSDISPYLYHYTNEQGLKGILENQCLWATHYKFLNDCSEIELFFNEKLFEFLCDNPIRLDAYPRTHQDFQELLNQDEAVIKKFHDLERAGFIQVIKQILADEIYITSFCSEINDQYTQQNGLLSQWRAYGGNGGYAIAFNLDALEELLKHEGEDFSYHYLDIHEVIYSHQDDKFKSEMSEEFKAINNFRQSATNNLIQGKSVSEVSDIGKNGIKALIKCMSSYKHQGFKEEKERRIIAFPCSRKTLLPEFQKRFNEKKLLSRNKNGVLVPYIEFFRSCDKDLPIEKIIVGPHKDKELRAESLRIMLKDTNLADKVKVSDIPYI